MTPKTRAERSAAAMWANDSASPWFGMSLETVDAGTATLSLTVQQHHTNGIGLCHGGVIFALADSAFAFACNSRNEAVVAQHNTITYVVPAKLGDRLVATAREVSLSGRNGLYDVDVRTDDGTLVAAFRGSSRTVGGRHFEE